MTIATCDHQVALDLPCPRCAPDPLHVEEDPWMAVTRCPRCGTSFLGEGVLTHFGTGFHAWDPAREPRTRTRLGWLPMAAALLLLAAVLAITTRPWEWLR